MTVHQDRLEFCGVGFHSPELGRYEISRQRIEAISPASFFGLVPRSYGIRVVSKPSRAFGDRDEYRFSFDSPALEEVLGVLRAAGYPVPAQR
jgi:hypothetical protein